jgi:hypothetical protein
VNGTSNRNTYTATAGQTTFASTYDPGYVDAYLNGVKLISGTDFTATSGTSIVLSSGAAVGDTVDIVGFGTFVVADTYTKTQADARYVEVAGDTMTGGLNVTGTVVAYGLESQGSGLVNLSVGSTNGSGAQIRLDGSANGDFAGGDYSVIQNKDSKLTIQGGTPNAPIEMQTHNGSGNKLRQNIASNGDISFYEDTGTTAKFFWDASAERLGIGSSSLNDATLEIRPATDIPQIKLTQNNVADGGDGWKLHASGPTGGNLAIIREASGSDYERMRFHINGGVSFGNTVDYGQTGEVLVSNGQNASPTWQTVSFTTNVITTNTTATANNHYYLNGATLTLTLPASPSVGDEVRLSEVAGNTDCIVGRNGSNIMGDASDLTIDSAYLVLSLRYVDATIGWAFS